MDEAQIRKMVTHGFAADDEQARAKLRAIENRRKKADMFLFYTAAGIVKQTFPGLLVWDERVYNNSSIRMAPIPSGTLGEFRGKHPEGIAFGRIFEHVSQNEPRIAVLKAQIDNYPYGDCKGIYLTPSSQDEIHARGGETYSKRYDLYRIEFQSVNADPILGMFNAWEGYDLGKQALVLSIPKRHVLEFAPDVR